MNEKQKLLKSVINAKNAYEDAFNAAINAYHIPHDGDEKCHDCGVMPGKQHIEGCDWERCPFCGGQAAACDCFHDGIPNEFLEREGVKQ